MEIDKPMTDEIQKQLHGKMQLGQGVYIGDIDDLMKTVENQMPIVDNEQIYLWELEKHGRIYTVFMVVGILIAILGALI